MIGGYAWDLLRNRLSSWLHPVSSVAIPNDWWLASDHIDGLEYLGIGFQPAKPMPAASLVGIRPHRRPGIPGHRVPTREADAGGVAGRHPTTSWIQPAVCLAGAADHLATRRVVSRKTAALDTARSVLGGRCGPPGYPTGGVPQDRSAGYSPQCIEAELQQRLEDRLGPA
ncbi:hypothetical protein [Mycobacterium tuberculosis]|uniref:hypothetical protein n=1 Tax=Mycobacterium tuberculosis TaxID=1773 RepID=UPI00272C1F12|nr:hypothetical protein [Mycobacterium tuberculosis]